MSTQVSNTLVYITSNSIVGAWVGIIVTFAVSGLLCEYGFDNGWGSIFYITGEFIHVCSILNPRPVSLGCPIPDCLLLTSRDAKIKSRGFPILESREVNITFQRLPCNDQN